MARSVIVRSWRETTPEGIEDELASLWREVAQEERVARAVMANLVVFRERTGARAGDRDVATEIPIEDVAANHPSRVIVIDHDYEYRPRSPIAAGVGVLRFGPPNARYAVEQIAVHCACAEESLPSIIRHLLRGDVPTSVWWAQDVSAVAPIDPIVSAARQFVYDSRRWRDIRSGVRALVPFIVRERRLDLADLNWRRLTQMRYALLHAATVRDIDALRAARVRVVHGPGDSALAWLVVGWLSARLHWPDSTRIPIEESPEADAAVTVLIGDGDDEWTATMYGDRVVVKHRSGAAPFSLPVPAEDKADAVAAELRNLAHDTCLDDTLLALARRFSAEASS